MMNMKDAARSFHSSFIIPHSSFFSGAAMEIVERAVEVDAPVESVFELLSDFESYPLWMRAVGEVRRTGRRRFLWRADAPAGRRVGWETETVVFEPDRRIVWRAVGGDVDVEGEVVLSETDRGTTLLRLVLGYGAPDERAALLVGRHPARQLDEDLARFARIAERRARQESSERGERRRPAARDERGVIWGDARGRGESDRRREEWAGRGPEERAGRGREPGGERVFRGEEGGRERRSELRERDRRFGEERRFERGGYERRSEGGERERRFEHGGRERRLEEEGREGRFESEARHAEALREAHRRQAEDARRYRDERERGRLRRERTSAGDDERGRRDDEDFPRARGRDERAPQEGGREEARGRREDERDAARRGRGGTEGGADERESSYRPRYALTPRERGMFAGNPNREEFGRMSRRGIDRLLDEEPPSRRWRGDD